MDKRIPISVFEDCAQRFAQRIAIEADDGTLTYAELDRAANTVAHGLQAEGFKPGNVAAVFIPNSAAYIVAVIGIQKAGGVFMPADPDAPHDRQISMFAKTQPTAVLADQEHIASFEQFHKTGELPQCALLVVSANGLSAINDDSGNTEEPAINAESSPQFLPAPDDDLYIIFTSGTTGTPKAVLGRQKGLAHFIAWEIKEFGLNETLRASNLAPTTFDVSLRDIFVPLCCGGTVVVPPPDIKTSPAGLLDWLNDRKISLTHIVPSIFRLLLDELEKRTETTGLLTNMKYFMLAGEAVYGRDVIRFRKTAGDTIGLVNLYGPSETTLAKLFQRLDFMPDNPARIMPLGNPISNTAAIILTGGRLAEIGEIYIKTPFRSKGYFRDPELTRAAFVVNPLTGDEDDLLYRTGDMGRYLPDRSVEFAGRLDRQVKINGVRVELSEVDEAVAAVPEIKQALVMPVVRENGETSLICYYTENAPVEHEQIRNNLATKLYSAMIPAFYVKMDAFPLGINGKINRRALPKPDSIIYEDSHFTAPESQTEIRLAQIWTEILGINKIGVTTSFNALGGGSMQAIRCAGAVSRTFGINLGIRDFLAADTIRALATRIDAGAAAEENIIPNQPHRPDYPATNSQQRLWTLHSMLPGFTAFNIAGCYRVKSAFNEEAFETALNRIIKRHEILRTVFFEREGQLRQRVLPKATFKLDHPAENNGNNAAEIADGYARTVFDLKHGPLLRAGIIDDKGNKLMVFVIHHIICDAWSLDIILRETMQEYSAVLNNNPSPAAPPLQYRDFAAWQASRLNSGALESQKDFWLQKLRDGVPRLNLPLDAPRPPRRSYRGGTVSRVIPQELLNAATAFAAANDVSLFAVLLAGYRILLYRYSGQNDIVVNAPVTLRGCHHQLESLPGDFTNTVLLVNHLENSMSFNAAVDDAARDIELAMQNREYPFDLLVQDLNVKGDLSRAPVSDAGITLVEDAGGSLPQNSFKLEPCDLDEGISKYDLVFHFSRAAAGLALSIEYDTAIFNRDRIERMADNLCTLLDNAITQPATAISEVEIIAPAEYNLIKSFQLPNKTGYADTTIPVAFAQVVQRRPEACALLEDNGTEISFRALDLFANRVSAMLMANGCTKGSRIAVHLPRSHQVPGTILGILKAGCVYVPLADDLPPARIAYMLNDCNAAAAITCRKLAANLPDTLQCLDIADVDNYPDTATACVIQPGDEAYLIYTSGSTGRPKGVRLPHCGLVNRARDLRDRAQINDNDCFTQFASLSFDASLYEMFASLLNGASLVIVRRNIIDDPDAFAKLIEKYRVTFTVLPPAYLRSLNRRKLPGLRILKTAGEAADPSDALHYARQLLYLNGYGPTEDSVCSTIFTVDPEREYPHGIPIGSPVADTETLVLDRNLHPVPIGVPGQLCVSDKGLALGYLNMPEATTAVFVPHPGAPDKRMYLTGDIVRWENDGNLLFCGRGDGQIKIGGHRIETGEIENVIKSIDGIVNACVTTTGSSADLRLAAYYSGSIAETKLRAALSSALPGYMIPHFFVQMEALPLNLSGKIDRKALPPAQKTTRTVNIREGSSPHEIALLKVIREVLGSDKIGMDDNFFAVGGDSIRAIQISQRLREQGWALSAGEVFVTPELSSLAQTVKRGRADIPQEPVSGPLPSTPIIEWFKENVTEHPEHFNQALMLKSAMALDMQILSAAIEAVWHRHDILRMVCHAESFSILPPETACKPVCIDLDHAANPDELMLSSAESIQSGFDLQQGPLFKAVLFKRATGNRLLLIAHHLVIDAVSWSIIVRDLETACRQLREQQPVALPPKTHSYRDWAETLRRFTADGGFDEEIPYWQKTAAAQCKTVFDARKQTRSMHSQSLQLANELTSGLISDSNSLSVQARLLAGLSAALHSWKELSNISIQLEGHGRGFALNGLDISRTAGWFTVSYPFLLPCNPDPQAALENIGLALRAVPNGGIGYGALRYLAGHAGLAAHTDIAFNYLGRLEFGESDFQPADEPTGENVAPGNNLGHALELLLSVVNGRLDINLTYDTGTITDKAAQQLLKLYGSALAELAPANGQTNGFALTPLQEAMLLSQQTRNDGAYIMQSRLQIDGQLEHAELQRAWQILTDRHQAMRLFISQNGVHPPQQKAVDKVVPVMPFFDLSNQSPDRSAMEINDFCRREQSTGFDIAQPPLFRTALFRLNPARHVFIMTFHHIIMDGWCQGILHDELLECCRAIRAGSSPQLPPAPPFKAYVDYLAQRNTAAGLAFWKNVLTDFEPGGETAWMKTPSAKRSDFVFKVIEFKLPEPLTARLRQQAAECGTTVNAAFQTLWGAMLCRLSGRRDTAWGTVVSGRPPELTGSDRTVGLFINTIPVRFQINPAASFKTALTATGKFFADSLEHQYVPPAEIQQQCGANNGLFDHLVIFENYPVSEHSAETGTILRITPESQLSGHTDYDLVCTADNDETIDLRLKYNAAVISSANITLLRDCLLLLAEQCTANPDAPLITLKALPDEIFAAVTNHLPEGASLPANATTFPAMFAAQAKQTPDRIAIEANGDSLSYRQLDNISNSIAHFLRTSGGIQPGDRVALITERDNTLLPSVIGIMKAAAVFVPLDPAYPAERIDFILRDSECRAVIAGGGALERMQRCKQVQVIDAAAIIAAAHNTVSAPPWPLADAPAYIIYTSGSTGTPKGVIVQHRALANFVQGYNAAVLNLHPAPLRIAFVANIIFDAAGRAFYPALCRGDTVIVVDEQTRLDGNALMQLLEQQTVDLLDGTPSLCSLAAESGSQLKTVKRIVMGGEPLTRTTAEHVAATFPAAALTNVYGPTETTIDSSFYHLNAETKQRWQTAPLGRPLPNQRIYVLDRELNPLPPGANGELVIGGYGLSAGYLGRAELTQQQFSADPFRPGERIYRTGDTGFWDSDGNLHYTGRLDSQVKIRGYRIEPGEIEAAAAQETGVGKSAVIVKTGRDGSASLCLYYTGSLQPPELRKRLKNRLPAHLVPDMAIAIERLPLTPTGKIDRAALSALPIEKPVIPESLSTNLSPTECLIIEAMSCVLENGGLSVSDSFFDAGGHSLKAARLVALLAAKTGKRLPLTALYRHPSPRELAEFLDRFDPALNSLMDEFSFTFNDKGPVIFCFPPFGATGIIYQSLSKALPDVRLRCFNYLAGIDFLSETVTAITEHESSRPVTMLGYSGGGNLAFEAARKIEARGGKIGHIIMIDSFRRMESVTIPRKKHEEEIRAILSSETYTPYFNDRHQFEQAVANGVAYADYLYSGIESGTIAAPLTVLASQQSKDDTGLNRHGARRSREAWAELTTGGFQIIPGHGVHEDMLVEQYCVLNAAIIRDLVRH